MNNFATVVTSLTDSLLFRWLLLLGVICAVIYVVGLAFFRLDRFLEERRRVRDLAKYQAEIAARREMTWDDIALGRVLAALDETDETFDPTLLPISQSPAAQRIREQIRLNHDAEVARFRAELDNYEQDGAA